MSTLQVENLIGPTSGSNANKVIIPSGQTLDASGGTLVPSPDQILQYKYGTTVTYTGSASSPFIATNLKVNITPKSANSVFLLHLTTAAWWNASTLNPAGNYVVLTLYKDGTTNIFDGLQYDAGAFQGSSGSNNNYDKTLTLSTAYTHGGAAGVSQEYKVYGKCYNVTSNEWRVSGGTSSNILHCWEIAQ